MIRATLGPDKNEEEDLCVGMSTTFEPDFHLEIPSDRLIGRGLGRETEIHGWPAKSEGLDGILSEMSERIAKS